jgi:hypothetical protein
VEGICKKRLVMADVDVQFKDISYAKAIQERGLWKSEKHFDVDVGRV